VEPIPGFGLGITPAHFHTAGKYRVRRTALHILTRMVTAHVGRCSRTPLDTPFQPGVLNIFRSLVASWVTALLAKSAQTARANTGVFTEFLTISLFAGHDGSFIG